MSKAKRIPIIAGTSRQAPPPPTEPARTVSPIGRMPPALDYDDGKLPLAMVTQLAEINPHFLEKQGAAGAIVALLCIAIAGFVGVVGILGQP